MPVIATRVGRVQCGNEVSISPSDFYLTAMAERADTPPFANKSGFLAGYLSVHRPAAAVDGMRSIILAVWVFARLRSRRCGADRQAWGKSTGHKPLAAAHVDRITLLASLKERERVVASGKLTRSLRGFVALTATERPARGRTLLFWAACLQYTSDAHPDMPSVD